MGGCVDQSLSQTYEGFHLEAETVLDQTSQPLASHAILCARSGAQHEETGLLLHRTKHNKTYEVRTCPFTYNTGHLTASWQRDTPVSVTEQPVLLHAATANQSLKPEKKRGPNSTSRHQRTGHAIHSRTIDCTPPPARPNHSPPSQSRINAITIIIEVLHHLPLGPSPCAPSCRSSFVEAPRRTESRRQRTKPRAACPPPLATAGRAPTIPHPHRRRSDRFCESRPSTHPASWHLS
jgi:hypothetical protein